MRVPSCLIVFVTVLAGAGIASADAFYIAPHLQNITTDGVTIIWETMEPGVGTVAYGLDGKNDQQASSATADKIHKVRISGLKPSTTYTYQVKAGADHLESAFKTAPTGQVPVTFIVIGDSRRWEKRWEETKMAAHTLQWNPDFYLIMGDLVVNGHKNELWPEHFKRFSELNHRYMLVTARGNHEGSATKDTENDWFAKYHELPGWGEPFAAFDWGNTHFMLASIDNTKEIPARLDQHMPTVHSKYTVVSQHLPIFCAGYYGPVDSRKMTGVPGKEMPNADPEMGIGPELIAKSFDKHHITLDLAGHTHIYERAFRIRDGKRDDAAGTAYVVNGGDINGNYPEWWTAVADDRTTEGKPTYTVVQCKDDEMEMRTFCWSTVENKIIEIDHLVIWTNEASPKGLLAELPKQTGDALVASIDRLGAMTYGPAAPALLPYLKNDDAKLRQTAARALCEIANADAAEELATYLGDKDLVVRRAVARALEKMAPEKLMDAIAKQALDAGQDETVRVSLLGAVQLHGSAKLAYDTAAAVLDSPAPAPVRQRASYAVGRVATKAELDALLKWVSDEKDPYVLTRLGWTLNNVTGIKVVIDGKTSTFPKSEPGKRQEFVDQWTGKVAKAA